MSNTRAPHPMIAKSPDTAGTAGADTAASATKALSPKTELVTDRPSPLDMASARALAKCIRAKLTGRSRIEDSTAIIRQFRNA